MDVETLASNVRKLLDAFGDKGICKGCNAEIWWLVTKNGKRAPYTAAAINHFADCPNAQQFRKKP